MTAEQGGQANQASGKRRGEVSVGKPEGKHGFAGTKCRSSCRKGAWKRSLVIRGVGREVFGSVDPRMPDRGRSADKSYSVLLTDSFPLVSPLRLPAAVYLELSQDLDSVLGVASAAERHGTRKSQALILAVGGFDELRHIPVIIIDFVDLLETFDGLFLVSH